MFSQCCVIIKHQYFRIYAKLISLAKSIFAYLLWICDLINILHLWKISNNKCIATLTKNNQKHCLQTTFSAIILPAWEALLCWPTISTSLTKLLRILQNRTIFGYIKTVNNFTRFSAICRCKSETDQWSFATLTKF